jgi:hypothetical protein
MSTDTATVETNATLVRTLIDDFLRGDLAAVAGHFHPDAVWHLPGRGVLAGEYHGPEAIVGFLARAFELSGGTLRLDVLDVMASPTGGSHVQRVTAEHAGRRLDCIEILAHEIRDGRISRTYHRPDAHAIDAFFD